MNLTPENARERIKEKILTAKGYASAEILVVLVRLAGTEWVPFTSLFRGPSSSVADKDKEYANVKLIRKGLTLAELSGLVDEWLAQNSVKLDELSIPLPFPNEQSFMESDQRWNYFSHRWP